MLKVVNILDESIGSTKNIHQRIKLFSILIVTSSFFSYFVNFPHNYAPATFFLNKFILSDVISSYLIVSTMTCVEAVHIYLKVQC